MARDQSNKNKITVAVLAAGGCIDTITAIKAGYTPIWATEICPIRRRMWEELTGTTCHGDTFSQDYSKLQRPDYLTSGQPCPDYSRSGSRAGEAGETGWMFTAQTQVIQLTRPKAFRLEMSDTAEEVNNGREVNQVITELASSYVISKQVLPVSQCGGTAIRRRGKGSSSSG
jgi:site-specific DNA-cytosine methylase